MASKDFAPRMGITNEQYSRLENGAKLTEAKDKLARLLVVTLSMEAALKEPELMERMRIRRGLQQSGRAGGLLLV